jgi:hypothetical protein
VTRPEASLALLALCAALDVITEGPTLATAQLADAAHAFAHGPPEVRANVRRAIDKVAVTLRIAAGPAADLYGRAAAIMAEVH